MDSIVNDQERLSSTRDKDRTPTSPSTPYELAAVWAASLGRAWPAVLLVGLLAVAAYFGVEQWFRIRSQHIVEITELNALRIKAVEAAASAAQVAAATRITILTEYQEQLRNLNDRTEQISTRMQAMAAAQLDSTSQLDKLSRQHFDDLERARKQELEKLRTQISAAEAQVKDNSLSQYKRIVETLEATEATPGLNWLQATQGLQLDLANPEIRRRAEADSVDNSLGVRIRLVILFELFRYGPDTRRPAQIANVLDTEKKSLRRADGAVIAGYCYLLNEKCLLLAAMAAKIELDPEYPMEFRTVVFSSIIGSSVPLTNELPKQLGRELSQRLSEHVRHNFAFAVVNEKENPCSTLTQLIRVVRSLDYFAFSPYLWQIVESDQTTPQSKQCAKDILGRILERRPPYLDPKFRPLFK